MTAVKEFVVEMKTSNNEHHLVKFKLVYDWLLYCHLVCSCTLVSASTNKHFPGAEDDDTLLDI